MLKLDHLFHCGVIEGKLNCRLSNIFFQNFSFLIRHWPAFIKTKLKDLDVFGVIKVVMSIFGSSVCSCL